MEFSSYLSHLGVQKVKLLHLKLDSLANILYYCNSEQIYSGVLSSEHVSLSYFFKKIVNSTVGIPPGESKLSREQREFPAKFAGSNCIMGFKISLYVDASD